MQAGHAPGGPGAEHRRLVNKASIGAPIQAAGAQLFNPGWPLGEEELYRHRIALLSASEPSTMDHVAGRMCQNKFGKQMLILKFYK